MSNSLLDQADALMRRRVFVAGANSEPAAPDESVQAIEPIESAATSTLEDVPVLTDVVNAKVAQEIQSHAEDTVYLQPEAIVAGQMETDASLLFNQLLMERQAILAREIETWLDEQLPQLVIRAMDGITDHLVALLSNRARDELLPRLEAALRQSDQEGAAGSGRNE